MIAASIPVMPVMMTSLMSISGWKLSSDSGLFSAKHSACLKARLIQDDCERIGNYLLVIGDEYLGF